MSGEPSPLPTPPQRPAPEGYDSWPTYWTAQGMPWRTEPDVDEKRQAYLAERRAVQPDIEQGIYPFGDDNNRIKLTRADVEWLLATLESGGMRGPVDWSDEKQRKREGLDLRGADLNEVNLHNLPLARLRGGHDNPNWLEAWSSHSLRVGRVHLNSARLDGAHLQGAILGNASMASAKLSGTDLEGAFLLGANLEGALLARAHLEGACLVWSVLTGAILQNTRLDGADLRLCVLDDISVLSDVSLGSPHDYVRLADVRWHGVTLAAVDWRPTDEGTQRRQETVILGDEQVARDQRHPNGKPKDANERLADFAAAMRANGQLATALRSQGLTEDADRFAYRAQFLQRQVLRRQQHRLRYFGSLLLDLVSGYGYKPMRSVIAYVLIIFLFAGAYLLNAQFAAPHLTWDEALVLSISSFHGRGFFSSGVSLGDTLARLAAGEAIIGLLIEITFIATFTQRFFAR